MSKRKLNVSIGEEYLELVEEMSQRQQRDKTKLIRILLDRAAVEMGLKPINPVLVDLGDASSPHFQAA